MSDSEYSVIKSNIIKRFDCITEEYFSDPEETMRSHRDRGVNTERRLLYRPRSHLVSRKPRPAWKKYWRSDPGLPVTNSVHGPFRETAMQAPLEARSQNPYYNCESSPFS